MAISLWDVIPFLKFLSLQYLTDCILVFSKKTICLKVFIQLRGVRKIFVKGLSSSNEEL